MALEGRDFDDKAIMSATKQEVGPNGSFRLKITLPMSGREVSSEWIREDQRRQALFAWVESIRGQAAMDIADFETERKERVLTERAKQSRLVGADGSALSPAQSTAVSVPSPYPAAAAPSAPAPAAVSPSSLTSSPDDYIADQLKRALIREAESADALRAAQRAHEDAVASLAKWQKLNEALGAK